MSPFKSHANIARLILPEFLETLEVRVWHMFFSLIENGALNV